MSNRFLKPFFRTFSVQILKKNVAVGFDQVPSPTIPKLGPCTLQNPSPHLPAPRIGASYVGMGVRRGPWGFHP